MKNGVADSLCFFTAVLVAFRPYSQGEGGIAAATTAAGFDDGKSTGAGTGVAETDCLLRFSMEEPRFALPPNAVLLFFVRFCFFPFDVAPFFSFGMGDLPLELVRFCFDFFDFFMVDFACTIARWYVAATPGCTLKEFSMTSF